MGRATPRSESGIRIAALAICVGVAALLARAVLAIPENEAGLAPTVAANLEASGVTNPVTAVLLNFRGYDTLLEIAVLMLATIGVLSLGVTRSGAWDPIVAKADPVLSAMARFIAPIMVLVSGYLLWVGAHAPGGAFQAGSILGAAGVLLALSGYAKPPRISHFALRAAVSVGFIVFLAVAIGEMVVGGNLLEYPVDLAKPLILLIETWLTVSIGAILISLFFSSVSPAEELRMRSGGDR